MYKRMNGQIWKLVDQGDGTTTMFALTEESPEYQTALAVIEAEEAGGNQQPQA